MSDSDERATLARIARQLHTQYRYELERRKEKGRTLAHQPHFLWRELVAAFATWGGSGGWDRLRADQEGRARLEYEALADLSPAQRLSQIQDVLKQASVRWPNRKARYLDEAFERIRRMGGPRKAAELLFSQDGAEAKLRFLTDFPGIGLKYARNIMIEAYDEDFRDIIPNHPRVKRVSTALDLRFDDYEDEESFYHAVARDAGISAWELDRLIHFHLEAFLEALGDEASAAS